MLRDKRIKPSKIISHGSSNNKIHMNIKQNMKNMQGVGHSRLQSMN